MSQAPVNIMKDLYAYMNIVSFNIALIYSLELYSFIWFIFLTFLPCTVNIREGKRRSYWYPCLRSCSHTLIQSYSHEFFAKFSHFYIITVKKGKVKNAQIHLTARTFTLTVTQHLQVDDEALAQTHRVDANHLVPVTLLLGALLNLKKGKNVSLVPSSHSNSRRVGSHNGHCQT